MLLKKPKMPLRDNMENQSLFNIVVVAVLGCVGWFARQLWDAIQSLKNDLKEIEVDLPTQYVRKVDIESRFDKLESILEKIFDRLDRKADK
jgi:hypothetical protein